MKLIDILGKKPIIIAEVGQNHQGSLKTAIKQIQYQTQQIMSK